MTEPEYRQDDRTDVGWCPVCGESLSALGTLSGFCERHGWQWADFYPPASDRDPGDRAERQREDAMFDRHDDEEA